jgi:dTDP-4-amino-4,6-dideoxygalactose transaminase
VKPRNSFLPYSRPDLDGSELDRISQALASGWITTGAMTHEFESGFAERVGAKHAIAVNSCTAALHLALDAVGLQPDDEVITTPYTFAATAEVVRYFGARPHFVDVEPDTMNLDPAAVAEAINGRTKALLPVHLGGHPAEMEALDELAAKNGLALIEDAAHSLPAAYRGATIGSGRPRLEGLPHLICFSFYATKNLTTGEGGMICTNDDAAAERCRLMALHGISKDAWNRYTQEGSWYYEIIAPGYKYNMTDVAAAMGLAQLARLDTMTQRRVRIAERYSETFAAVAQVETPVSRPEVTHAWHLYMLRLVLDRLSIDRSRFIEELQARNIGTSVHFIPLHLHPYYQSTYGFRAEDYPVAYREYMREISLPIYSAMTDEDVEDVIGAVTDVAQRFRA